MGDASDWEREHRRLRVLAALDILDTPGEERFDRITRMAREILRVPAAVLDFVDADRVWLKSAQGIEDLDAPRCHSFADQVVRAGAPLSVPDAQRDDRFRGHAWVAGAGGARFFAGQPLVVEGEAVGTLSLVGPYPRRLTPVEARALADLGALTQRELGVRRFSSGQELALRGQDRQGRQAHLDPATRAWNREGIRTVLAHELDLARRNGTALGLVLARLGGVGALGPFPALSRGKAALRQTAERLRGSVRPGDALGRWDDTSFLLVLPGWDAGTTGRVAEHLHAAVVGEPVVDALGRRTSLTLGVGVTALPAGGELEAAELLGLVERALREAPSAASGGVRTVRVPEPPGSGDAGQHLDRRTRPVAEEFAVGA